MAFYANYTLATGASVGGGQYGNSPISDVNPYYAQDHFQWGNYNDGVHLLAAYSATVVGALLLEHKLGMKRWQAALTMTLAIGLFGTAKEVFHDNYTSRTDIKMWWAGAASGGLTVWVLQF